MDPTSKIERYNRSIGEIEDLLTWWESLTKVEQSSTASTARLISEGERIIGDERKAWQSTGNKKAKEGDESVGDEGKPKRSAQVAPA